MTFVHESNGRFSLVEFTRGRQKIFINRSTEHPSSYKMFCAIWWHLCNLKNMKSTHGGMLLLRNLLAEAEAWNLTNSNTTPWVFFTFFKLYKWYRIMQSIIYNFNKFSKKLARIVKRVSTFFLWIFRWRNMNYSNCIKSLITKISNACAHILETKKLAENVVLFSKKQCLLLIF